MNAHTALYRAPVVECVRNEARAFVASYGVADPNGDLARGVAKIFAPLSMKFAAEPTLGKEPR